MDLDDEVTVARPARSRRAQIGRRGGGDALPGDLVVVGVAGVDLVHRQYVGLAAEPADPLDPANEAGAILGLDAPQLARRRARAEELRELLIDRALDAGQVAARLCGPAYPEAAPDLAQVHVGSDIGRDLLVVHEPLVEPRSRPRRQHIAHEIEIVAVRGTELRDIPLPIDARLRHAVLHDLPVRAGAFGDPHVLLGNGR